MTQTPGNIWRTKQQEHAVKVLGRGRQMRVWSGWAAIHRKRISQRRRVFCACAQWKRRQDVPRDLQELQIRRPPPIGLQATHSQLPIHVPNRPMLSTLRKHYVFPDHFLDTGIHHWTRHLKSSKLYRAVEMSETEQVPQRVMGESWVPHLRSQSKDSWAQIPRKHH